MCGIVGVWNARNEPVRAAALECIRDTLLSRGVGRIYLPRVHFNRDAPQRSYRVHNK